MSSKLSSLSVTDPTSVPGSLMTSRSAVPPGPQIDPGGVIETVEHPQFASYPSIVNVPLVQPHPPPIRSLNSQCNTPSRSGAQTQLAIGMGTPTPSHQLMSSLTATCGSNLAELLRAQGLGNQQRADSMQSIGHNHYFGLSQSAGLPGLDHLNGHMSDNRISLSAGLPGLQGVGEGSAFAQNQMPFSQQPGQQFSPSGMALNNLERAVNKIMSPGYSQQQMSDIGFLRSATPQLGQGLNTVGWRPDLGISNERILNDRNAQFSAMRTRAASYQPMAQQGDCSAFSVRNNGSPTQGMASPSPFVRMSYLSGGDSTRLANAQGSQLSRDERAMSQQIVQSSHRLISPSGNGSLVSSYSQCGQVVSPGQFERNKTDAYYPPNGPRGYQQPFDARAMSMPAISHQPAIMSVGEDFALINQGRLSANRQALSQSPLIPEENLNGLSVADSYALITRSLSRSTHGAQPGLPNAGGLGSSEPQCGDSWAEQPTTSQALLTNTVAAVITGDDQLVGPLPQPKAITFDSTLNEDQCYQSVPKRTGSGLSVAEGPHKPMFGFSSMSEAENFQLAPCKSGLSYYEHDMRLNEDRTSQLPGHDGKSLETKRPKIVFGFPSMAEALSSGKRPEPAVPLVNPFGGPWASDDRAKHEETFPRAFVDYKEIGGNFESNPSAAQTWNSFAAPPFGSRELPVFTSSAGFNGKGPSQTSLGGPLAELEPGEIVEPNRYTNIEGSLGEDHIHSLGCSTDQFNIGKIDVDRLTNHQVLFIFQVLAMMANLRPEFVYQQGNEEGKQFGVKLTMWGHTVKIDPFTDSINAAKVAACRRALELMQESNPEWHIPPQPINGITTPDWNWLWILADYCAERDWPPPLYRPSSFGNLWHCDITVKGKLFRTVRECSGLGEAQNTAAHTALHQLMIIELDSPLNESFSKLSTRVSATAPSTSAPVPLSVEKQCAGIIRSGKGLNPKKAARSSQYAGITKAAPLTAAQKKSARKNRQNQARAQAANNPNARPPIPAVPRAVAKPKPKPGVNSNMIPLGISRLPPPCEETPISQDPLAKLRSIERGLRQMSPEASFRKIMQKICDVLGANYPTITRKLNPGGRYPHMYEVFAEFDSSHPYLNRASPIKLANVERSNSEAAEDIGVKHVILHMIKMEKEDADVSEKTYQNQLRKLDSIEKETTERLQRQNRPSGSLPY